MAAGLLWILDASTNISMEPYHAFVEDLVPEDQRTLGIGPTPERLDLRMCAENGFGSNRRLGFSPNRES